MKQPKIYSMDDYYWMAAYNKKDAKRGFLKFLGDVGDETDGEIEPTRLTDEQLDSLTFYDDLMQKEISASRSFREELDRRVADGDTLPFLFAVSDDAI